MCKFLIDSGAPLNQKGGESVATPLQWAAQRCHYYTVHLLLQHGADPLITDAQGYNTLHISTFNGNVLLIVLLLHQGIPVEDLVYNKSGRLDLDDLKSKLTDQVAAVIVQTPNFFGILEELKEIAPLVQSKGALLVVAFTEAVALGLI